MVVTVFGISSGGRGDELARVEFALGILVLLGGFRAGCCVVCKVAGSPDSLGWASWFPQ